MAELVYLYIFALNISFTGRDAILHFPWPFWKGSLSDRLKLNTGEIFFRQEIITLRIAAFRPVLIFLPTIRHHACEYAGRNSLTFTI